MPIYLLYRQLIGWFLIMTTLETTSTARLAGKYLTFMLSRECYGIPVLKVREIIRLAAITPVPQMPSEVKGVINLRGKIIPVIDLCVKFGMDHTASTDNACIVVVQVNGPENRQIQLGLMVDGVEEVCQFAAADIEETPEFGATVNTTYILGMAKAKGVVKTLLDIDRVVGVSAALAATAATSAQTGNPAAAKA
jgi:purine-binding chemotaxis protein CheW